MLNYDFTNLNDKEFEALSVDVLSTCLNSRIERFKPGKDNGVDGRYFASANNEAIIQCKHWSKTGIQALIKYLGEVERVKVDRLRPARYFLTTSLPLSRANKTAIQQALAPWISDPADIFGQEDLNNLLARYPEIEERHHKLWFTSMNVVKRLLSAPISGRSDFKLKEAQAFSKNYVVTTSYNKALNKLKALGALIITGDPGVGKSTLAEQIALSYVVNGYELCCVASSIEEAEAVWSETKMQMFYFDDFLGRNYLNALEKHEDSHIMAFIKRVQNNKQKRFILTSRTTVLNQGKMLSDLFRIENLDRNEYELCIDALTRLEKAQILYGHIWSSRLSEAYIDEIYEDERYLKITDHRNFNPRLIAFIADAYKIGDIQPSSYWSYIKETLDNPADVWRHVFDSQLTEDARILVKLAVLNGGEIAEDQLKEAFYNTRSGTEKRRESIDVFRVALKITVGSVLKRVIERGNERVKIALFNPSLGDFIVRRYSNDNFEITTFLVALRTKESINNLRSLRWAKAVAEADVSKILMNVASQLLTDSGASREYRIVLAQECADRIGQDTKFAVLDSFIQEVLAGKDWRCEVGRQAELLYAGLMRAVIEQNSEECMDKLAVLIDEAVDFQDFNDISKPLDVMASEQRDVNLPRFFERYVSIWKDNIDEQVSEYDVLEEITDSDHLRKATSMVVEFIEGRFEDLSVHPPSGLAEEIAGYCNIDSIVDRNRQNEWDRTDGPRKAEVSTATDERAAICDLFDRS